MIYAYLMLGSLLVASVGGSIAHHHDLRAAAVRADLAWLASLGVAEIRPRSHRQPKRRTPLWARLLSVGARPNGYGAPTECSRHLEAEAAAEQAAWDTIIAHGWTTAEQAELRELVT